MSNQGGTYVGYGSGNNVDTGSDYNTFMGIYSGLSVTTGARVAPQCSRHA